MKFYIQTYAIRNPHDPDRYVIGFQACSYGLAHLPNSRLISSYNMVILKSANPWGFKGAQKSVILSYLSTSEFHVTPLFPLAKAKAPIPITRDGSVEIDFKHLTLENLAEDIRKALDKPVFIDEYETFESKEHKLPWKVWTEGSIMGATDISSVSYLLKKEDASVLFSPYYVIKISEGRYLSDTGDSVDDLLLCQQFDSEDEALEFSDDDFKHLRNGFEVKEIPGCIPKLLRIR